VKSLLLGGGSGNFTGSFCTQPGLQHFGAGGGCFAAAPGIAAPMSSRFSWPSLRALDGQELLSPTDCGPTMCALALLTTELLPISRRGGAGLVLPGKTRGLFEPGGG